jgi:hypothetical protein
VPDTPIAVFRAKHSGSGSSGAGAYGEISPRREYFSARNRAEIPKMARRHSGAYCHHRHWLCLYAGLADQKIVTTLCPGGKERMRRLMAMVSTGRVDLRPLMTHAFALDDIHEAFDLFSHQRDGVLKVALYPDASRVNAMNVIAARGAKEPDSNYLVTSTIRPRQ